MTRGNRAFTRAWFPLDPLLAVAWRLRGEGRGSSRETKGAMRCLTCLKRFLMTTSWTRRTS